MLSYRSRSLALSALVNGAMLLALFAAVSRDERRGIVDSDLQMFDVTPIMVAEPPPVSEPAPAATPAVAHDASSSTSPSVPYSAEATPIPTIPPALPVAPLPSVAVAVANDVPVSSPAVAPPVLVAALPTAAAVPPTGAADDYARQVLAWLSRYKRFPERLARQLDGGLVVVRFTLDSTGRARECHVIRASGSEALDELAVEQVRSASPFPRPRDGRAAPRVFEVPMRYRAT